MGTKNNPGSYDAEPDEPMFVLLGRDRHAPVLVRLWALLRHRDDEDEEKVAEALRCADAMADWLRAIGKPPFEGDEPMLIAATRGMDEHPEGYEHPCECDECCTYQ